MTPLEGLRAVREISRDVLPATARALLWALLLRADGATWRARTGVETLAEDAGLGLTAAKAALRTLVELGLVERPENGGGARCVSWTQVVIARLRELAEQGRAERVASRPVEPWNRSPDDRGTGRQTTAEPVATRPGSALVFCPTTDPPLAPPDGGERAPSTERSDGAKPSELALVEQLLDRAEADWQRASELPPAVEVEGEPVSVVEVAALLADHLGPEDAAHVRHWPGADGVLEVWHPDVDGWRNDVVEALEVGRVRARVRAGDGPRLVGASPRARVRAGDVALVRALVSAAGLGNRERTVHRVAQALRRLA